MSATIHIADGTAVALDEPQSKEYDSLPLPSTTGTASSKSISSGLKLFQILHYLNPLFYARLVQAYIQTVLRSYSTADGNGNARITDGKSLPQNAEIVRGTTIDNCFTTVSPEFEYSCRLGMDGAYHSGTSAVHISAPLSDVSLHLPQAESTGDASVSIHEEQAGFSGGQVAETIATMGASAAPPVDATTPVSTHPTEQDDKTVDVTEGKRTRKAKRGKGKGKAKP
ncbi:hypothetical protein GGH93_000360 [Coemansia aciculifera]|nr:hypothetical protein GGH93_000360 [Coemansia aciculifera]